MLREKTALKLQQRSVLLPPPSETLSPTYLAFRPSVQSHRRAEPPKRGRVTDAVLSSASMALSGSSTPIVSLREYEKMRSELSRIARDFGSARFGEAFTLSEGHAGSAPVPMSDDEEEEEEEGLQPLLAANLAAQRRGDSGSSEVTSNTRLTDSISPRSDLTQSPRL